MDFGFPVNILSERLVNRHPFDCANLVDVYTLTVKQVNKFAKLLQFGCLVGRRWGWGDV
jgi:hypothetical protein